LEKCSLGFVLAFLVHVFCAVFEGEAAEDVVALAAVFDELEEDLVVEGCQFFIGASLEKKR